MYVTISSQMNLIMNALNKSKLFFFSSSKELTFSLLLTKLEAFMDSADQDQTAQNVHSDL